MKTTAIKTAVIAAILLLQACSTYRPSAMDDACKIFGDHKKWYKQARHSTEKYGTPIATQLAFIYQESRFKDNARPPRTTFLGFIPGPRKSDAYGYAQVKDDTWQWYKSKAGVWGVDRDDFGDTVLFVGWYNQQSQKQLGIGLGDAYNQYLAYHEGHGGYKRKTYTKKPSLIAVAKKVSVRAQMYQRQITHCEKELNSSGFWFF
ncbi:MAG: hypothetical protein U5M23_11575 [Marinagarivorans sp.]|nr:hypothetical protein [Marinagarivorans sp.]